MVKTADEARRTDWDWGVAYRDTLRDLTTREVYMRRWILRLPTGRAMRIHCIHKPDVVALHDHPFNMLIWVIKGGYLESFPAVDPANLNPDLRERILREGVFARHVSPSWWPRYVPAAKPHRISALPNGPSWSFLLTGKRRRVWGFETLAGWVPFFDYRGEA